MAKATFDGVGEASAGRSCLCSRTRSAGSLRVKDAGVETTSPASPRAGPHLDRFIGEWYGTAEQSWSSYLSAVFRNVRPKPTLSCLKIIQHEHCRFLSLLRVWDILLWKQKFDAQQA